MKAKGLKVVMLLVSVAGALTGDPRLPQGGRIGQTLSSNQIESKPVPLPINHGPLFPVAGLPSAPSRPQALTRPPEKSEFNPEFIQPCGMYFQDAAFLIDARPLRIQSAEGMPAAGAKLQTGDLAGNEAHAISLDVLAAMVSDDPWQDALSGHEDNPFTHFLFGREEMESLDSKMWLDIGGPPPKDPSADDPADDPVDDPETPEKDQNTKKPPAEEEARGPEVLFIQWNGQRFIKIEARQITDNRYKTATGQVLQAETRWTAGTRGMLDFFVLDDFNRDGFSDMLLIHRKDGSYQPFFGNGFSWQSLDAGVFRSVPACAASFKLFDPMEKNIVAYSNYLQSLDVYDFQPDGKLQRVMSLNLPQRYDGVGGSDLNNDGFDDLLLMNMKDKFAHYILNLAGRSLYPLTRDQVEPAVPEPFQHTFKISGVAINGWFYCYGNQHLLYLYNVYRQLMPVMNLNPLDTKSCLLLGDINQDGFLDYGLARLRQ